MKTLITLSLALAMLACLYNSSHEHDCLHSCSASETAVDIYQADGSKLSIVGKGNYLINHTETTDGYTIVMNKGIYEYAELNAEGKLAPSGVRAKNVHARSDQEKQYLSQKKKHVTIKAAEKRRLLNSELNAQQRTSFTSFPNNGSHKVLTILIQYPDLANTYSKTDFKNLMNQTNYNGTGSFKDFYLKNSNGKLNLEVDVFGWYTAQHNHAHYGNNQGQAATKELVAEAIDAAEAAGVDFSRYDNDNDGELDGIVIVHAGPGAEIGAQSQYIWSQRSVLYGDFVRDYDGVRIEDYIINPEVRPWGMVGIGIFCHEFGHLLGFPDLYDVDNSSAGIGKWSLMGKGSWFNDEQTPANLCAWAKEKYGWLEPTVINEGHFELKDADGSFDCYRINTQNPSEYFLLEYKKQVGNDVFLPGEGLAIWHIDVEKTELYPGSNQVNMDENNKGVDLEEADGLNALDLFQSNGDNGDLFPGSANNLSFGLNGSPSSTTYNNQNANIEITNIQNLGDKVKFTLNGHLLPCSISDFQVLGSENCGDSEFDLLVEVEYHSPNQDDKIWANGQAFETTGSPQTIALKNLPADGNWLDLNLSIGQNNDGCKLEERAVYKAPKSYNLEVYATTCKESEVGITASYLNSVDGCDSIVVTHFEYLASEITYIERSTCDENLQPDTTVVESSDGCDSMVVVNYRFEEVVANFEVIQDGLSIQLVNNSKNAYKYIWDFGDGTSTGGQAPSHEYADAGSYTVQLTALGYGETCEPVYLEETIEVEKVITSIEEEWNAALEFYPNPVYNELNIKLSNAKADCQQIQILNVQGQLAQQFDVGQRDINNSYNLSGLQSGSYYVQLIFENNVEVFKILKM